MLSSETLSGQTRAEESPGEGDPAGRFVSAADAVPRTLDQPGRDLGVRPRRRRRGLTQRWFDPSAAAAVHPADSGAVPAGVGGLRDRCHRGIHPVVWYRRRIPRRIAPDGLDGTAAGADAFRRRRLPGRGVVRRLAGRRPRRRPDARSPPTSPTRWPRPTRTNT